MKTNPKFSIMLLTLGAMLWACAPLNATILFSEDFESGLSQWNQVAGVIVTDPDPTYGSVLTFTIATSGSDCWSIFTAPAGSYLSFDYRGTGGFMGLSSAPHTTQIWLAGASGYSIGNQSSDFAALNYDGTWGHYQVSVPTSGSMTAEIYLYASGSPYSATFDNIVVSDLPIGPVSPRDPYQPPGPDPTVPEPTTMIAGALLLLPFGASALRSLRKRQVS